MDKRVNYNICDSEREILQLFALRFQEVSDFSIETEKKMNCEGKTHIYDIVVNYAGKSVAIAEIKKQESHAPDFTEYLKQQLDYYRKIDSVKFFFAIVGDDFYSYDLEKGDLVAQSEKDVFEMIIKSVYEQSESCDELMQSIRNHIKKIDKWKVYRETLLKFFKKGSLRKIGNIIFLNEDIEKDFMHELLWTDTDCSDKIFCRYTSAVNFYLSLKNGFRFNDVEVMNDELESKVINSYSHLNPSSCNLSNYIYNGFIMCFSKMSRFDKLFNWYMYGDRAKGACFAIEAKEQIGDGFFFAPVTYISKNEEGKNLLSFLNDLMGLEFCNNYKFVLRFWHYWKFFFKYDYYKEEDEVRLLIIQKEEGETEWSEDLNMPYHFICKKYNELPFKIKSVLLGPKRSNPDNLISYIKNDTDISCIIKDSEIKGYR